jgi:hypothetical protein
MRQKLLYAGAYKHWTGMGGTKFPLKHKAFAKRFRSRDVGDAGNVGRIGALRRMGAAAGVLTIFSFAYRAGRIDSSE